MSRNPSSLTGAWRLEFARSRAGLPPFSALHTYGADGSMTGAASAMGRNTESPAHGIWTAEGGAFTSLFEVLSFDECGELTGVVRVRTRIRMDGLDRITGEAVVDVIPTGEAPQSDVDAAVFEGVRIKL